MELKRALVLFGLLGIFAGGFGAESSDGLKLSSPLSKLLMRGGAGAGEIAEALQAAIEKRSAESKESTNGPLNVILLLVDELHRSGVPLYLENRDEYPVQGNLETCPTAAGASMPSTCNCDEKLGSNIASLISMAQGVNMSTGQIPEPSVIYNSELDELTPNVLKELERNEHGHLVIMRTGMNAVNGVLKILNRYVTQPNTLVVMMSSCPQDHSNQFVPFFAGGFGSEELYHAVDSRPLHDLPLAIHAVIDQYKIANEEYIKSAMTTMSEEPIVQKDRIGRSLDYVRMADDPVPPASPEGDAGGDAGGPAFDLTTCAKTTEGLKCVEEQLAKVIADVKCTGEKAKDCIEKTVMQALTKWYKEKTSAEVKCSGAKPKGRKKRNDPPVFDLKECNGKKGTAGTKCVEGKLIKMLENPACSADAAACAKAIMRALTTFFTNKAKAECVKPKPPPRVGKTSGQAAVTQSTMMIVTVLTATISYAMKF